MAGYLIANIEVTDMAEFARYRAAVPAVVESFGGRYLIRGNEPDTVEGEQLFSRLVVLEFASLAVARAFYDSTAYAPLKALRMAASRSQISLVEGIGG